MALTLNFAPLIFTCVREQFPERGHPQSRVQVARKMGLGWTTGVGSVGSWGKCWWGQVLRHVKDQRLCLVPVFPTALLSCLFFFHLFLLVGG